MIKRFAKIIQASLALLIFLLMPGMAFASTLSMVPANGSYGKGCTFQLKINLDTSNVRTDGTDAYIIFDPKVLTPSQFTVTPGTLYANYPTNVDASGGRIEISGISDVANAYAGSGTFATVSFQVNSDAAVAPFSVKFDFDAQDKAKLSDTNVISHDTQADTLDSVTNGQYSVTSTGACAGGSSSSSSSGTSGAGHVGAVGDASSSGAFPTPIGYVAPTQTLPTSGAFETTLFLGVAGAIFILIGLIGAAVF